MPHGTPDWGHVGPISVLYGLDDLGEQAVRVGAVPSWDRIGHVLFSDDFQEGLGAWRAYVSSADGILCLFTGDAQSYPYCVKMVNGSVSGSYARMEHYFGYEYRGICGLECNVAFGPDIEYIKFGLGSRSATARQYFYVRYTPLTGEVAHGSDGAGWTPFANTGPRLCNIWTWHNVKLVANFLTGFFVKFVWEGTPFDMRAIPCVTLGAAPPYYWLIYIENDSSTTDQYEMRLDNVIATVDEP